MARASWWLLGRSRPLSMRRSGIGIHPGDHACLVYDTPAEQLGVAAAYIRAGPDAGERCVYLVGDRRLSDVIEALEDRGIDVAREVSSGALQFDTTARAYLGGGAFEPRTMIDLVLEKRAAALRGGYSGLWAAGEMGWAADGHATLVEYERDLNEAVFGAGRVTGLCQYERSRFAPARLAEVIAAHPVVLDPASAGGAI